MWDEAKRIRSLEDRVSSLEDNLSALGRNQHMVIRDPCSAWGVRSVTLGEVILAILEKMNVILEWDKGRPSGVVAKKNRQPHIKEGKEE